MKRYATKYPGVFYREAERIGGSGIERVYYVVFMRDGAVIEEKAGRQFADNMTPAKAAVIRADRIENRRPSPKEKREKRKTKRLTLNALWEAYKEANPGNKTLSFEDRKFTVHLKDSIGRKEPRDLSPLDVDRIRLNLQKADLFTTAARVLELLRRTINFGVKRGLIEPIKFKIAVPKLNNETTEDLKPDELKRLMDVLEKDPDRECAALMRLALFTGMRRGELFRLQWADLDFERGFIRLRDPKGGKDQTIPMSEPARKVLGGLTIDPESPYVFPSRRKPGEPLTDMRKSIDRIRTAAALPEGFRPLHGLRHVYASMLASSGAVDMFTLQKLLTHKSPIMTQRYAHLRDDTLKRAANLAGDIVSAAVEAEKAKERKHGSKTSEAVEAKAG
jgi:integrase